MTDTPTPTAPLPRWRVVSQQEGVQPGPSGTYTKGMTVYFTLDTGETGSVFVPNTQLNPEYVKAAITARAVQLSSIGLLTSE